MIAIQIHLVTLMLTVLEDMPTVVTKGNLKHRS